MTEVTGPTRVFKAMIWKSGSSDPGQRVSISAESLKDAREMLEAEYGEGSVFDLHAEDDAQRPR